MTLASLARQTVDYGDYEIIVVVDGSTDDTITAVTGAAIACPVTRIDLAWSGRAVARNRGAAAARGNILLFLDDDMEASPGLIEAHLYAHSRSPCGVVLGRFPMKCALQPGDPVSEFLQNWWNRQLAAWAEERHQFDFRDFCTGNVSLPRHVFEQAGGFDERFPTQSAGEDWELGYRLLKIGVPFRFVSEALTFQHCRPLCQDMLRRADEEGRGHAFIATEHPELRDRLILGQLARITRNSWTRPLPAMLWAAPSLTLPFAAFLRFGSELLRKFGLNAMFWRMHRLVWAYNYWKGVHISIPSWPAWKSMSGAPAKVEARPDRNAPRRKEQVR
jgi:glycosyltransferase involved in cell wall biosynthesis